MPLPHKQSESKAVKECVPLARKPEIKELTNTRLLKEYASWAYCDGCNQTVAYLCYVTYDCIAFTYTCHCGNQGKIFIQFAPDDFQASSQPLQLLKNRLCCPADASPLLTVVEKNVAAYTLRVLCNTCHHVYYQHKTP